MTSLPPAPEPFATGTAPVDDGVQTSQALAAAYAGTDRAALDPDPVERAGGRGSP